MDSYSAGLILAGPLFRSFARVLLQWSKRSGFWSPNLPEIWIGFRFPSHRIRIRVIQMKKSGRAKILYGIIVVWGKIAIFRNHVLKIYLSDFSL